MQMALFDINESRCAQLVKKQKQKASKPQTKEPTPSYLLTGGRIAADGRGVTDVLVVTTTVRVLDGVHGNTADLGPAVALDAVLVVRAAGLEDGLVDTATTGDDTNSGAGLGLDEHLAARGEADAGLASLLVLGDDGGVVTRRARELSAVTRASLDVADDGTCECDNGRGVGLDQHTTENIA